MPTPITPIVLVLPLLPTPPAEPRQGPMRTPLTAIVLVLPFVPVHTTAADPAPAAADLDRRFRDTVQPFLKTYCSDCHGQQKQRAELDFRDYPTLESVAKDH